MSISSTSTPRHINTKQTAQPSLISSVHIKLIIANNKHNMHKMYLIISFIHFFIIIISFIIIYFIFTFTRQTLHVYLVPSIYAHTRTRTLEPITLCNWRLSCIRERSPGRVRTLLYKQIVSLTITS